MLEKIIFRKEKSRNPCVSTVSGLEWQGQKVSNPRPTVLETVALPAELFPYEVVIKWKRNALLLEWWAFGDSNPGPTGYEPVALTN